MGTRTVIAAAAAVVALAVGSWALLRVGVGERAEHFEAPSPSATPIPSATSTSTPTAIGIPTTTAKPTAIPSSSPAPSPKPSPPLRAGAGAQPRWEDVPFTERPEDLGGALARAVADGVIDLHEHLALCFSVEPSGPRPPAGPEGDPEPPALELRLEARGDEVEVADAVVDTYGPSISLVTCARERVKGFRFPAPETAGRRIRLGFPLQ
jgi:hypothetical protein